MSTQNKWVSYDNPVKVIEINLRDKTIEVEYGSEYLHLKWEGSIKFFKDGNGVGHIWEDYSHDLEFKNVDENCENFLDICDDLVDWITEHIAECKYSQMTLEYEDLFYE